MGQSTAWVLVGTGGADPAAAAAIDAAATRLMGVIEGVQVRSAILGGTPNFGTTLRQLADGGHTDVTVLPLWFTLSGAAAEDLDRTYRRAEELRPELTLHIAPPLGAVVDLAAAARHAAAAAQPIAYPLATTGDGRTREERRKATPPPTPQLVLACTGASCIGAGGWEISELLMEQLKEHRLKGTRVVRTACLGPCSAAPVAHVLPDGTWYGGLAAEDAGRVAREHFAGGEPCADLELHALASREQ